MSAWIMFSGHSFRELGFLPDILRANDKRPVKDQLEDRYAHGGGWRPIKGFTMDKNRVLRFPEDPPFYPAAIIVIGGETVIFYPNCSLLAVIAKDGSFEVTRVD
jgi:hypothetical protein